MYKWFVYMLAKTEKKAGKFKIDKSVCSSYSKLSSGSNDFRQ